MLNVGHTMHVAASVVQATHPVTFVDVPAPSPNRPTSLHGEVARENIIAERGWQVDCDFLQDSFQINEFLPDVFADEDNDLRQEITDEISVKQCCTANGIATPKHGWGVRGELGSKLIEPHEISSDRYVSREHCLTPKLKATCSPESSKKSLPSTGYRRKREKANRREKQRIVVMKNAMNVLKNAIPTAREKTKVTKLEILKLAQEYISSLAVQLLENSGEEGCEDEMALCQPLVFDQEGLFVYCDYSQREYEVTMGNSWDSLAL